MIECQICGRNYKYRRSAGHTKSKCNSCLVNQRRFKIKKRAILYKGGKCSKCGYDKCAEALNFHHVNPSEKHFEISGSHSKSWLKIKKELDKCILVCANCHAEIHFEEKHGPIA